MYPLEKMGDLVRYLNRFLFRFADRLSSSHPLVRWCLWWSPSYGIERVGAAFAAGFIEGFNNPRPLTANDLEWLHRSARAAVFWYDEVEEEASSS